MGMGIQGIKSNVKRTVLQKKGTIVLRDGPENDELMRRLRAWKLRKREFQNAKFMEKLGNSQVDLDDASIKILVLKLMEIEILLKEVGKQKKKVNK